MINFDVMKINLSNFKWLQRRKSFKLVLLNRMNFRNTYIILGRFFCDDGLLRSKNVYLLCVVI